METDIVQPASQVVEALQDLHPGVHGVVGLLLIAGLILWMWGRRVLKPMTVLLFGASGAYLAFFLFPTTALSDLEVSVGIWLLVGLAFGALIGLLVYRSSMAVGFGLVLAIAAPAASSLTLNRPPTGFEERPPEAMVSNDAALAQAEPRPIAPGFERIGRSEAMGEVTDRTKIFLNAAKDELLSIWSSLEARHRVVLATSALTGLSLGVLLGLFLPGWAAGTVTSMTGSALWLPSAVWLLHAYSVPGRDVLGTLDTRAWLFIWAGASVVGMLLQWRSGRARTAAAVGGDDDDD